MLAGVGAGYYTRLERGSLTNASNAVLDPLSRALQLEESERSHLYDLARIAKTTARPATARTVWTAAPAKLSGSRRGRPR